MYPELLTRTDLKIFLLPLEGSRSTYSETWMRSQTQTRPSRCASTMSVTGRMSLGVIYAHAGHILSMGLRLLFEPHSKVGRGVVIYYRKEGRALGEVTKYLVYNARKRQEGGDRPEEYFNCTAKVAGVEDSRFQALMPDALHWLGITKIDKFVSMSNMKYDAIVKKRG